MEVLEAERGASKKNVGFIVVAIGRSRHGNLKEEEGLWDSITMGTLLDNSGCKHEIWWFLKKIVDIFFSS